MFFSIAKWVVIIGISVGSYIVVQPYIDRTVQVYDSLQSTQTQSKSLQDYLKSFENSVKYNLPK